ncbi:T9SS type A sorting domain-containing protein [Lacinutrix algicola]|uniref:T9SS type A sorting domain-containing protein n=1 Tax=Lacinutrix algicola TaxID=342954 RepID=UPI0006E1A9C2|nr:fibronectin type III domain-containing protein [Lacinutrix algicola]
MKKITLLFLMMFSFVFTFSQVIINENFDAGAPSGWTNTYSNTTSSSCAGKSERDNIYSASATGNLTTPNQIALSNATDLTVSFDYKIMEFAYGTPTVATSAGWGTAELQYSTDDGTNWSTILLIDDSNHVVATTCVNVSAIVPAASLPNGGDVKLRISNVWASGDYYFYIDNFIANQVVTDPPNCDVVLTSPSNGAINVSLSGDISWSAATGVPTGYNLTVGTTSGGSEVLTTTDVGDVTTYTLIGLVEATTYYVSIVPYNVVGNATSCTEYNFTTGSTPSNNDCSNATALIVGEIFTDNALIGQSNLLATGSGETPLPSCSSYDPVDTSGYGGDLWYTAVVPAHGKLSIEVNGDPAGDGGDSGMQVYTGSCGAFTALECDDDDSLDGAYSLIELDNITLAGQTIYIRVFEYGGNAQINFQVSAYAPTCPNPSAGVATEITDVSAKLGWTAEGIETTWNLEWGIDGFTQGSGTIISSTSNNPETLTGLMPSTAYDFYVKADCGGGDLSDWVGPYSFSTIASCIEVSGVSVSNITDTSMDISWTAGFANDSALVEVYLDGDSAANSDTPIYTNASATGGMDTANGLLSNTDYDVYVTGQCGVATTAVQGPVSFTTLCGSVTIFPSTTDFSSNPPTCWTEAGAGEVVDGPTGTTSDWKSGRAYTDGSGNVINSNVINLYDDDDREWLMSPIYNIPVGLSHSLVINVALTDYKYSGTSIASNTDTMGSDDQVQLLQSVDAGVTWTNITTWNASNQPAVTGTEYEEDLSAVSGNIQFALWASDGSVNDSEDYDFHVGGFSILPSAPSNDECANADVLTVGTMVSGDTTYATDSGVAASSCGAAGADQDIWYSFTATAAMATEGASFTTTADHLMVYADCTAASEVACLATGENTSALTSGVTYIVRAYNSGTAKVAGPIEITLQEGSLSTAGFDAKSIFSYYPNPVNNTLTLNAQQAITNVSVFNMLGQQVLRNVPNAVTKTLDMSNLQSGAYFVQVTVGTSVETVRIIKN